MEPLCPSMASFLVHVHGSFPLVLKIHIRFSNLLFHCSPLKQKINMCDDRDGQVRINLISKFCFTFQKGHIKYPPPSKLICSLCVFSDKLWLLAHFSPLSSAYSALQMRKRCRSSLCTWAREFLMSQTYLYETKGFIPSTLLFLRS